MPPAETTLSALIIDDEPLARQELRYLLERAGDVAVIGEGSNGIEAVDLIRSHRPSVVFLDVRMPGLDGFAVLKKVMALDRENGGNMCLPQIVFATAFDQYAVRAFEVNAVDYLLKPFDFNRVIRTLEKLRGVTRAVEPAPEELVRHGKDHAEDCNAPRTVTAAAREVEEVEPLQPEKIDTPAVNRWGGLLPAAIAGAEAKLDALLRMIEGQAQSATGSNGASRNARVVVRVGSRLMLVDQKDVCFALIEEGRIAVITSAFEGESTVRTLEELQEQLDPDNFWRAHRSYLVNLQHIHEVVPWFKSTYQLRMDDRKATEIPVSRTQTRRLRELFNL